MNENLSGSLEGSQTTEQAGCWMLGAMAVRTGRTSQMRREVQEELGQVRSSGKAFWEERILSVQP